MYFLQRKTYSPGHSNFTSHYINQAGNGFSDIEVYRGAPYQRGYGFGSTIARFAIPIVKFLGKKLLKAGVDIGSDLLLKRGFKESVKQRGKETLKGIAKDSLEKASAYLEQTGSGIKRKRLYKAKSKKKKDIFG